MKKVLLTSLLLAGSFTSVYAASPNYNKGNNYDRSVYGSYTPNPNWKSSQYVNNNGVSSTYSDRIGTDNMRYQSTNYSNNQSDWRDDIYVGANVGHSNLRHFGGSDLGPGISADNSDTSYGLYTGYQFHKNFSTELGYNKLGDYSTSNGDVRASSWNLSLVGRYDFTPRVAGTARLGVGFTNVKYEGDSHNKSTPVYGLGLEYAVNKQVALTTGWDRYQNFGDTGHKLDNFSVGMKYKF